MGFRLQNATLHPPALSPGDDDAEIPWVLLDERAYVADCTNDTTAKSTTWDNKEIQVTFCLACPPQVSYMCVFCPGLDHTEFPFEPRILAMEQDLVLISIVVSSKRDAFEDMDYYIYQAADKSAGGGPSLKRLPRPPQPYCFNSTNVGILRCGTSHKSKFFMRRHGNIADEDFYVLAGLCMPCDPKPGQFILCHYNSKVPTHWSTHSTSATLSRQQMIQHEGYFKHYNSKVISIGGDGGTMGFVDLWRGILFCDVLKIVQGEKSIAPLGYVVLPTPFRPDSKCTGDARLSRDIAVIEDEEGTMIKYVHLQVQTKPARSPGFILIDGWVSRTWKIPVSATYSEHSWVPECRCESSLICADKIQHFQLPPKVLDSEGRPLPPFKVLDIRQPTLSLNDADDGIVYFMIKKDRMDGKGWVISVDMKENILQGASEFAAQRTFDGTFTYMHSRISKYLRRAPGTMGILKRSGTVLLGYSSKRHLSMLGWNNIARPADAEMEDFCMELD